MKLDLRRAVQSAFAPVACAALLAACAPYEPYDPGYSASPGGAPAASYPSQSLSHFDRLDSNRDGFVSRGELDAAGIVLRPAVPVETADAVFHRLDVNRDGFLSRGEAEGTLAGIPGASFDSTDANRDGFLSLTEAMPHLRWLETRGAAGSTLSFEALDRDRDGFLTRAEAEPLLRSPQYSGGRYVGAPGPGVPISFEGMDRDRDGFLSRSEAAVVANPPTFDRYDVNRDGFLSRGEADVMFRSGVGGTTGAYGGTVYGPR
jgi:Ca2+-binding EF-hand superfamily protein